jgi:hypothetical protein
MGIYLKSHQSCLQIFMGEGRCPHSCSPPPLLGIAQGSVKYLPTYNFKRQWLLATYFSNIAPYSSPYWQPWHLVKVRIQWSKFPFSSKSVSASFVFMFRLPLREIFFMFWLWYHKKDKYFSCSDYGTIKKINIFHVLIMVPSKREIFFMFSLWYHKKREIFFMFSLWYHKKEIP